MYISIKIENFEGPLDLLLHLIEKNKLPIADVSISMVTDQYIEILQAMEKNKMDVMSEFIEMAATLISIKAKMLVPKEAENTEEEDPREALMYQLLEYKKYKKIAEKLRIRVDEAKKIVFKKESIPDEIKAYVPKADPDKLLEDLAFSQLYHVFQSVMKKNIDRKDPLRENFGTIEKEVFTVQDKVADILSRKDWMPRLSFLDLLEEKTTRAELITIFLAILELMKINKIKVMQEKVFDDIFIEFV